MSILWLSWKEWNHPQAGGAELVMHELAKRLVADGRKVTILTARYPGSEKASSIDGIDIIRVGANRYTHSFMALSYYLRHLRGKFDLNIEVVNTAPYFSVFFKGKTRAMLFYHQLARQIWFYEAPFPLNYLGYYVLEPAATFLLGKAGVPVVTVSESTKQDLVRFGFREKSVSIISEGIELDPIASLGKAKKFDQPTLLSLGALRAMKRTLHQVKAFEIAKTKIPKLQLKIAGDANDAYGQSVLSYIAQSPHKKDIQYLGRVPNMQRLELMQKCHIILQTPVKEGWGLTVTEAASQGTPAVAYDADGLRDSIKTGETGVITKPNEEALANGIIEILNNNQQYEKLRKNAWQWSKQVTFEQCYKDFQRTIK